MVAVVVIDVVDEVDVVLVVASALYSSTTSHVQATINVNAGRYSDGGGWNIGCAEGAG